MPVMISEPRRIASIAIAVDPPSSLLDRRRLTGARPIAGAKRRWIAGV
jgi:hypothetical protein